MCTPTARLKKEQSWDLDGKPGPDKARRVTQPKKSQEQRPEVETARGSIFKNPITVYTHYLISTL